jgi:glycosyltransferase involved in cell wall biosynthesis
LTLSQARTEWARWRGYEFFDYPPLQKFIARLPHPPQVIHLHNLHPDYFDLRELPALSAAYPVALSLHDMWLMTGHCAHSLGCERWEAGCGACPDLRLYPAMGRDRTDENWATKAAIFRASRLGLMTPSQWLMERAQKSLLWPGVVKAEVIPLGVDLEIFKPGDRQKARAALDIPAEAAVVLVMGAAFYGNMFKDYPTLMAAIEHIALTWEEDRPLIFIALGHTAPPRTLEEGVFLRFIPYQHDPAALVPYYQAADVLLHPSKAETYGLAIAEATACGLPSIATAVGALPEIIRSASAPGLRLEGRVLYHGTDTATGILCGRRDQPIGLVMALKWLLQNPATAQQLGDNAAAYARQAFDLNREIDQTLAFYADFIQTLKHPTAQHGR